eukprot:5675622-Pleurochrysis_carterae.AAC.1
MNSFPSGPDRTASKSSIRLTSAARAPWSMSRDAMPASKECCVAQSMRTASNAFCTCGARCVRHAQ